MSKNMIYDYLIIGAGISGAAAAYELSTHGTVVVIEAESMPGYHSTGRSAALYTPNYGNAIVRRINQISKPFFQNPPPGFCNTPLLTPRGHLTVALPGDTEKLTPILQLSIPQAPIEKLTAAEACELAPLLDPKYVESAAFETDVADIEVSTLHQAYLGAVKRRGGTVTCSLRVEDIIRKEGAWHVSGNGQKVMGKTIINAAGAWADQVAIMAGATPSNLVAKRRTAIIVDLPQHIDPLTHLPAIDFADCNGYLKPEAGKLMVSPGDETPIEPQDAWPEDWDIAVLVDWLENRTLIDVQRVEHSWAGLRTFAPDDIPVVGYDPIIEDFFWLAGQGGYGIMMAPALGRATAALITTGLLCADMISMGVEEQCISPSRFVENTPDLL
jgi:D-arginine dehydrogenase